MKVIENNFLDHSATAKAIVPDTFDICCEHCSSKLQVSKSDLKEGYLGAYFVECPCCNQTSYVDTIDGVDLTPKNVCFPQHFWHTSTSKGAVHIRDAEIVDCIQKGALYFEENPQNNVWHTSYGDLFIVMMKFDHEYSIYVTQDFYHTEIFANDDVVERVKMEQVAENYRLDF